METISKDLGMRTENIRILNIGTNYGGSQAITVLLSKVAATRILVIGHIKVGLVYYRVRDSQKRPRSVGTAIRGNTGAEKTGARIAGGMVSTVTLQRSAQLHQNKRRSSKRTPSDGRSPMISFIQVNLNNSRDAHALLKATAAERYVDLLIISDPYNVSVHPWWCGSTKSKSTIYVSESIEVSHSGQEHD